jgi:autotransporter-associated beta strand protein
MKTKSTLLKFILLAGSTLLAASSIHAASTWNAGTAVSTDGLWSTSTNWSADTAPVDGADLIFDGTDNPNNSNDIPLTSIGSLTLNNAGWNITLGTLTLGGGIAAAGNATLGGTLTLGAPQSWSNTTGLLTVNGTVNNGANLLTVNGAGNTTVSAILGNGAGGLTKDGAGTLTLSAANTYGGTTTLTNGTLQGLVVGTSLTPTSPLGTSSLSLNGGILQLRASGTVNATAETITLGNNAAVGGNTTIDVNRPGATSTTKTIQLGTLSIGANTLTVTGANTYGVRFGATTASGAATFTANTGALTLDSLTLGDSITTGTTTTITVGGTGSSSIGPITNNTLDSTKQLALTKTGAGTARMPGLAYAFTGNISVEGGTLDFSSASNDAVNRTLGGGNYAGNIDITSGATFQFWRNTGNQEFSGVISGGGNVRLAHKGNYTLSGPNTYTGKTTIHGEFNGNTATLNVSSFNSIVSGSIVTGMGPVATPVASSSLGRPTTAANGTVDIGRTAMQASAVLNYTGAGETTDRVMNLVASGNSQRKGVNNLGTGTLTFTSPWTGVAGVHNNIIPITTNADMVLSGSVPDHFVSLEKRGNAKLSLSGPCTIWNNVHLYAGTLEIDSEINDGGVYSGAITTGSGNGGTNFIAVPAGTPLAVGMTIVHPRFTAGTTITAIVDINANPVEAQVSSNSDTTLRTETGYIGFKGALGIFAPAAANLRWLGNATLKYDGPNDSTNRNFTVDNGFTSTWEIITGSTLEVSGATTNTTGKLTKTGAGTLVLSGALLHDGVNNVDAGTLLINGNSSGMTGAVNVNNTAILGGTGTIGGSVDVGASAGLAPGASAGTLTIVGDLDISLLAGLGGGSLDFELDDPLPSTDSDKIAANTLTIGTGLLRFTDFTFSDLGNLANGTYVLVTTTSGITGTLDTNPANLSGPVGAGTGTLQITGNNVELVVTGIGGGDTTPPTLTSITDNVSGGPVNIGATVTYTVTFSEDMDDTTVTTADFGNNGTAVATIDSVTETTPGVFSVVVTPTSPGTLVLRINALAVLEDVAGNDLDTDPALLDDTTITVRNAYQTWALTNAISSAPGADKDGDGVNNAIEFLLGGDFATNDLSKLPEVTMTATEMIITFERKRSSIDGITGCTIEVGTTLTGWPTTYTVGSNTAGSTAGVVVTENSPAGFDTITLTVPIGSDPKKFARLNANVTE